MNKQKIFFTLCVFAVKNLLRATPCKPSVKLCERKKHYTENHWDYTEYHRANPEGM